MATTPEQVAAMAQQIKSVVKREGWTSDASVAPSMQQILGKLTTLKVDVGLLKETNIGAMVRKLTKHDDEIVRGYSTSLMKKWMQQVGVPPSKDKDKDRSRSSSTHRPAEPTATPSKGDAQRLEQARKRLQDGYASEKAKRDSRTVQVLQRPLIKGKKGTTITTGPSRSAIAQHRMAQQRRASSGAAAPARGASAPPAVRSAPTGVLSREEQHRLRQQKLRALREKNLRENGSFNDAYTSSSRTSATAAGRSGSASRTASSSSSSKASAPARSSARAAPEPPVSDRKAFLDKMFPRVCGVGSAPQTKASGAKKNPVNARGSTSGSAGAGGASKKTAAAYNEGQREVLAWLKGLEVDMSEYAPAFFENGFDSIKLLGNIEKEDLPGLIPKKGHHRLIQQALDDLKRKHRTAASSSRGHGARRDRAMPKRRNPYSDEDSDDSFVVSDGDEYTPGVISGMFRKNRKRSYSFDSVDSYNMEASFDEIQHEEERSARYGEYEDFREELRNKKLLKKKK